MISVVILFRELRLYDNRAIDWAKNQDCILLFCFDPVQTQDNPYFSDVAFKMLCECVGNLPIHIEIGSHIDALSKLSRKHNVNEVIFAEDYTPFAQARQKRITTWCNEQKIECNTVNDHTLSWPAKPYVKYSPFAKQAMVISAVSGKTRKNIIKPTTIRKTVDANGRRYSLEGYDHRRTALRLIQRSGEMRNYLTTRNMLNYDGTTGLSRYIKFGVVSIREVWNGCHPSIRSELLWRDFYYQVAFYNPHVFGAPLYSKWSGLKWGRSMRLFNAWCEGKTGYPIVDAGMRQLNTTGWMHNRARMITASFLTKLMRIDWRWGERYFATKLVDYDPCQNNGGWQWSAGIGADAQPYFRIFSPEAQHKKHDPESTYVKQYVEELRDMPHKNILKLYNGGHGYIPPVIDYQESRKYSIAWFRDV